MQHNLVGPSGKPLLALGGEYAWRQHVKGDVMVSFQWINDEPCMCLFPALQVMTKKGAYVIGLSALYKYVESDGHPTRYLVAKSVEIAAAIGFQPGKDVCFRLIEAIADGAEDLLDMPPTPRVVLDQHKPATSGTLSIKSGGRVVHEAEV